MRHREQFFLTFFLFLFFSLVVFAIGKTNAISEIRGTIELVTTPMLRATKSIFQLPKNFFENSDLQKLQDENTKLRKKLIDQTELEKENSALKDQFKISYPKSTTLLEAKIIGSPGFLPGISPPSFLVIDKGAKDGILMGLAVVVKDTVIGKIIKVSSHVSVITLVSDVRSSFTAQVHSLALGVIKGEGGAEMVLENVLLSEELNIGDTVVTKGDVDQSGIGYPPNLIVGKITSIDKKPSSLFQTARVKSLLDFSALSTVFIVTGFK